MAPSVTKKILGLLVFVTLALSFSFVFARGGGGGSEGSSSGGGYTSSSVSSKGNSSKPSPQYFHGNCVSSTQNQSEEQCEDEKILGKIVLFMVFSFIILLTFVSAFKHKLRKKEALKNIDPVLLSRVNEVYFQFQKAWSEFDVVTLQKITTQNFYTQLVLELSVLKNEKRENRMTNVEIDYAYLDPEKYPKDKIMSSFTVEVRGRADDSLFDTELQKVLYSDSSWFFEFWNFVLDEGVWKLSSIDQSTANSLSVKKSIADFATKNKFFYSPDFGWLMIPNKGNLFSNASFKTSDVNNHVIGTYKNKIVEFYSIIFVQGKEEYFIGQAILPTSYGQIIIERKNKYSFIEKIPKGLEKISLESVVFNDEFNVYADRSDAVTTFELLHPVYMEYIMGLPYKINIEVVGNTVYFYTTSKDVDYDKLLEILSRAFDEIKE